MVDDYESIFRLAGVSKDWAFAEHVEVNLCLVKVRHQAKTGPEEGAFFRKSWLTIRVDPELTEEGSWPFQCGIVLYVVVSYLETLLFLNLWHLDYQVYSLSDLFLVWRVDLNDTAKGFGVARELWDDDSWDPEFLLPLLDGDEFEWWDALTIS